jgi:predicted esterase
VVLAGVSGGATQALGLGLTARFPTRGIVAIAAYLRVIREFTRLIEGGGGTGLRSYLVVGDQDQDGYVGATELAAILAGHSIPARVETHLGLGHEYPEDMSATLASALAFVDA